MSNEILTIDGVNLRGQGFGAATRTGRYSVPARRGDNLILPGTSGSKFVANKPYEEGVGALSLWAIGANTDGNGNLSIPATMALRRVAFENNMQTIMRLFTRAHRLSRIVAAQADGSQREAYVEWREWSEPEVQAGGTRAEWAISYTIPDVWWQDTSPTSQTGSGTLNLTNFANMTGVIEDAVLSVSAGGSSVSNPRITDLQTGNYVQYTGTLSAGSTWTVNVANSTSTVGGSSVMGNTTHTGGFRLFSIPNEYQGTNTPRISVSGGTLTLSALRKWAHG